MQICQGCGLSEVDSPDWSFTQSLLLIMEQMQVNFALSWRHSKPTWMYSCVTCSEWPWLDDLQRSLPILIILWFLFPLLSLQPSVNALGNVNQQCVLAPGVSSILLQGQRAVGLCVIKINPIWSSSSWSFSSCSGSSRCWHISVICILLQDLETCRLRLDPEMDRHRYERKISFAGVLDENEDSKDSLHSSSHTLKSEAGFEEKKGLSEQ